MRGPTTGGVDDARVQRERRLRVSLTPSREAPPGSPALRSGRARSDGSIRLALWIGGLCGLGLLFWTAWMSDDAYITLRTIDNAWRGYGVRWNAMERVQAYTHPLWMLLVGAAYGVTREAQLTTLAVSAACTIAAVAIAVARVAPTAGRGLVLLALLLGSKTFVDFSTSGLENPLTHLLIALWFASAYAPLPPHRSRGTGKAGASGLASAFAPSPPHRSRGTGRAGASGFRWQLWRDARDERASNDDGGRGRDGDGNPSALAARLAEDRGGAHQDGGRGGPGGPGGDDPERLELRRLSRLAWLAGLVALNRLDTLVLIAPMLAAEAIVAMPALRWRALRAVVVGFLPLVAWELFSLIYYGQWFPNTAYAKLWAGVPARELQVQGLYYLRDALIVDLIALPAIAVAIGWSLWRRGREAMVGVSLLAGLAYVVAAGGDFMSGRFLSPAFFLAALWLGRTLPLDAPRWALAAAIGLTLVSVTSAQSPWRVWQVPKASDPLVSHGHGIIDERALYYPHTGLVPLLRGTGAPAKFSWGETGRLWRQGLPRVAIFEAVGLLGYYSGPGVHIIDPMALADPLLARLPPSAARRVGHFTRELPPGYVATIERCLAIVFPRGSVTPRLPPCIDAPDRANLIADPRTAALYDRLALITQAPLFDPRRLRAIVSLHTGASAER